MAEGRVYPCSWEKVGKAYRLWVTRKPKLVGEGRSFNAAREALWSAVCMALGDGEAIFEFDPPEPMDDVVRRLRNPEIVEIAGNTWIDITADPDLLFENGLCPQCRGPRGPRTSEPLAIDSIESAYEGGFTRLAHRHVFSEAFLALLKPAERKQFEWRRVAKAGRSKRVFYELIGTPTVPLVAMRGLEYGPQYQCDTCGDAGSPRYYPRRGQDQTLRDAGISAFVSRGDLPGIAWFIVGRPQYHSLGVRQERWLELARQRGARGIVSIPIGVLDPTQVTRDRKLTKRSVADRLASKMMEQFNKLITRRR